MPASGARAGKPPRKSKAALAVLAERSQAVVPVGAWVEPAAPAGAGPPAAVLACMIEAELKEQLRRKQEALTRFQRQVRHRVNQQVRLRKMQQPQRCDGAAEKRGSPAMQSSGPGHFSSKAASVCSGRVEAAAGISGSPPSQVLEGAAEGGQSWAALLPQQAQAVSTS